MRNGDDAPPGRLDVREQPAAPPAGSSPAEQARRERVEAEQVAHLGRLRARQAALRTRAGQLSERAEAERGRHGSVDAVYELVERDQEVGGGIIAGALAYRLFIWLLPLALVAVVGLGVVSDAASESPEQAADSVGLTGIVSGSVASAAESSTRWYALLIGIPVLLFATRSVLRALIGAHRLIWGDVRSAVPKPTLRATVRLLALLVAAIAFIGVAGAARKSGVGLGVLASILVAVPYIGIWLLVSLGLPHRGTDWTALLPGAVLFGFGFEVLHLIGAYVLAPYSITKQGTYGVLGAAAVLLLALFMLSRLIVFTAMLNTTIWDRQHPRS
jgi:uncharacterized BrkB/YihY/UPF0761 family membrane protein